MNVPEADMTHVGTKERQEYTALVRTVVIAHSSEGQVLRSIKCTLDEDGGEEEFSSRDIGLSE